MRKKSKQKSKKIVKNDMFTNIYCIKNIWFISYLFYVTPMKMLHYFNFYSLWWVCNYNIFIDR